MTFKLTGFDLDQFVRDTLAEDLGEGLPGGGRDVTSESVIPADARFAGVMDTRDDIKVAGLPVAEAFFRALDPDMTIEILVEEGAQVSGGTDLMRLEGNARAMLTAERSALNTVQHLSGIATMVAEYVRAMDNPDCTLLDTRKTIPGLRQLEKYAVRMGGGSNHRMGLWDAAMIKDNHVLVAGSVGEAVRRAVAAGVNDIICEVDRIDQIEPALAAGATQTGASVIVVDSGVDTGPILAQERVPVLPGDDEHTLHDRIKPVERRLLIDVVQRIASGELDLSAAASTT